MTQLSATDLLAPTGTLVPALYPHLSGPAVQQQLDEWLLLGYQAATAAGVTDPAKQDKVAEAFASLRWYQGALDRIIGSPTTAALNDKESHTYSSKQLELLQQRIDYWQGQLDAALAPPTVVVTTDPTPSGAQPAAFYF